MTDAAPAAALQEIEGSLGAMRGALRSGDAAAVAAALEELERTLASAARIDPDSLVQDDHERLMQLQRTLQLTQGEINVQAERTARRLASLGGAAPAAGYSRSGRPLGRGARKRTSA